MIGNSSFTYLIFSFFIVKTCNKMYALGIGEMAQQVKLLSAKTEDLSSTPGTEGET